MSFFSLTSYTKKCTLFILLFLPLPLACMEKETPSQEEPFFIKQQESEETPVLYIKTTNGTVHPIQFSTSPTSLYKSPYITELVQKYNNTPDNESGTKTNPFFLALSDVQYDLISDLLQKLSSLPYRPSITSYSPYAKFRKKQVQQDTISHFLTTIPLPEIRNLLHAATYLQLHDIAKIIQNKASNLFFYIKTNDNTKYSIPSLSPLCDAELIKNLFKNKEKFRQQGTEDNPFNLGISSDDFELVTKCLQDSQHGLLSIICFGKFELDDINTLIRVGTYLAWKELFEYLVPRLVALLSDVETTQEWLDAGGDVYLFKNSLLAKALKKYFDQHLNEKFTKLSSFKTFNGDDPKGVYNVRHIAFDPLDPTGSHCIMSTSTRIQFWNNITTENPIKEAISLTEYDVPLFYYEYVQNILWRPDGNYIAIEAKRFIYFLDHTGNVATGADKSTIGVNKNDGFKSQLLGYSRDNTLFFLRAGRFFAFSPDMKSKEISEPILLFSHPLSHFSYDPCNNNIAFFSPGTKVPHNKVYIFNILTHETSKIAYDFPFDDQNRVAWNKDGTLLAYSTLDPAKTKSGKRHVVHIYNTITQKSSTFPEHACARYLAFTNNNNLIIAPTNMYDPAISTWNLGGAQLSSAPLGTVTTKTIALHPNRKYLAVTYPNNEFEIWRIGPDFVAELLLEAMEQEPYKKKNIEASPLFPQ